MPAYAGALDFAEGEVQRYKVVALSVNGPASYTAGGFQVVIDDLHEVKEAIVAIRNNPGNKLVRYNWSGNTITIQIYTVSANTSTGEITAAEDADGTDESSLVFDILVIGW